MIKLTQEEIDVLHCKNGSRQEFYRLDLVDKYGVKKCTLEMIDGTISTDSNRPIQKTGTLVYRVPSIVRKVETIAPNAYATLISQNGKQYSLGIESNGIIYTVETKDKVSTKTTQIKVQDDGILYTENITLESVDFELIDLDGYTWNVGVEATGEIYSKRADLERRIYYRDTKVEIDFLNDRVKAFMGVKIGDKIKWWPQGVLLNIKPKIKNGIVEAQAFDESIIVQRTRLLEPKLFAKGTNYVEVLKFLLIYCGILKINIEPTNLVLQTDVLIDSKKNNLDWFNYFTEQINYTSLSVDGEGYFISKKFIEPTPLNVDYIYEANSISVMSGDLDTVIDSFNVYNVFRRTVAHPQLGELTSLYINNDPLDKYSVVNTTMNYSEETVDNIASQAELDNLTRKLAFKAKQVMQEVTFNTLNMPHHTTNNILDLRHPSARGIVVEQAHTIKLKKGELMQHVVKRLVNLND